MNAAFPRMMILLRKERGISQKQAAADLHISQALLSHYEKGIRECGQSFLVKVADFYGVTCDFLLGRTTSRNYRGGLDDLAEIELNDENPSISTFVKAGLILSDYMKKNDSIGGIKLDIVMSLEIYKVILSQAAAGNLPKNWAGRAYSDGALINSHVYTSIVEHAASHARETTKNKNPQPDTAIPAAVRTLVETAEDYVVSYCTKRTPPVPEKFMK